MILSTRGLITEGLGERGWTLRGTIADDGGGGGTATVIAGGTVNCRIDTIGGTGEDVVADRISDRSTHLVTLGPGNVIRAADGFAIDGRGVYEVTAVREHTGELATVFEVVERD